MRPTLALRTLLILATIGGFSLVRTAFAQPGELPLLELPGSEQAGGWPRVVGGYDAEGTLRRVRHEATQAERLAVLGEQGQIQAFLTPTPRINLRDYLGKRIGVMAKSVTEPVEGPPSIIVDRVVVLSRGGQPSADSQLLLGDLQPPAPQRAVGTSVRHVDFEAAAPAGAATYGAQQYAVRPAQHEVIVGDDWAVSDDGALAGATCSSGTCGMDACGSASCGHCGSCNTCGPPGWMWVRAEYLLLWAGGMDIPPLVTGGGATPAVAGVLGQEDTQLLLGDETILTDGRSGFRIRFGGYWGPGRRVMWEGEYFGTGSATLRFSESSDGNGSPALARPFFNINPRDPDTGLLTPPALEDSELVSFPGILAGTVSVDGDSEMRSAGGRLRWNICCKQATCGRNACGPCGGPGMILHPFGYSRLDFLAGYRYFGLSEELLIREDLTTLQAPAGRFEIFDQFETRNEFHGGEVGFIWEGAWRRWTLECLSKVALGNVHQVVLIDGGTTISPLTSPQQTFSGGLLAQASNIGRYSQDDFGVLPELGVTLGLYLTPRLRATVGYTFLFLSPVVRPGEQISLDVNPDQLPPAVDPVEGPLRPAFAFQETDLWANGLNVGLDLRW